MGTHRGLVAALAFAVRLQALLPGAWAEGACAEGQPSARTEYGDVCGVVKDNTYDCFMGIPYARPPIGDLRFKPPEEPEAWEEPRNATRPGRECPQPFSPLGGRMAKGSEDCLYLNVYTPHVRSADKPLSVMVWIHGGAFHSGSGGPQFYGADNLMAYDVVLVTLNYRLGPLGFLDMQSEEAPGNAGLRDQVAGLGWVQRNVAAFGGDPGSVTVFGESAGSASVHLLTLSPLAQGLFHKAIMQSGVALNPWAYKSPEQAAGNARALVKSVQCPEDASKEEQIACLRRVPALRLVAPVSAGRSEEDEKAMLQIAFTPTLDGVVLPAEPRALLASASRVPILSGNTDREGFISMPLLRMPKGRERWQEALERGEPAHTFGMDAEKMGPAFQRHFMHDKRLSKDNDMDFVIAFGEWQFIEGNMEALRSRLESDSPPPQYLYSFSFNGTKNYAKTAFGAKDLKGAAHADELFYLFNNSLFPSQSDDASPESRCTRAITTFWTNFAKFGDPTPEGSDMPKWEPYTKERPVHMEIGSEVRLVEGDVAPEHRRFWRACREGNYDA